MKLICRSLVLLFTFTYIVVVIIPLRRQLSLYLYIDQQPSETALSVQDLDADLSINFEPVNITYMKERENRYSSWFIGPQNPKPRLRHNADVNGTIIDFIVGGAPKCGTTTLSANLAEIAPMPIGDYCMSAKKLVELSYLSWPEEYGDENKIYRGTKCPQYLSDTQTLRQFSNHLPRTKIIFGIRHPVLWFQSFWNMQAVNNNSIRIGAVKPYDLTETCEGRDKCKATFCPNFLFCTHRSRFHLHLAQLGKTPLSETERNFLAPHDYDGGQHVQSFTVRNQIFLFEQAQLKEDYLWDDLSNFLGYHGKIRHDLYRGSHGKPGRQNDTDIPRMDICDDEYDELRRLMMPYAYEMYHWICSYFIKSDDVFVSDPDKFCAILREFEKDPCGKLVRNERGEYALPV